MNTQHDFESTENLLIELMDLIKISNTRDLLNEPVSMTVEARIAEIEHELDRR